MTDIKKTNLKITALANSHGMTVKALAEKIGVDRSEWSLWVKGEKTPDDATLEKICEILGCTKEDFAEDTSSHKKKSGASSSHKVSEETPKADKSEKQKKTDIPAEKELAEPYMNPPEPQEEAFSPTEIKDTAKEKKTAKKKPERATKRHKEDVLVTETELRSAMGLKKGDKITPETLSTLLEAYKGRAMEEYRNVLNLISLLGQEIVAGTEKKEEIKGKYKKLLDVAKDATDEGIDIAITVLEKCRRK